MFCAHAHKDRHIQVVSRRFSWYINEHKLYMVSEVVLQPKYGKIFSKILFIQVLLVLSNLSTTSAGCWI